PGRVAGWAYVARLPSPLGGLHGVAGLGVDGLHCRRACSRPPVLGPPRGAGAVSLEVVPMNRPVPGLSGVCVAVLHARFLRLLPKVETHARIAFRGVRCPVKQEDRVQECVALGWKWFLRLSEQGKDVFAFPMAFAALLARAVKCGRRLCGQERSGDVLSFVAQQRHAFRVELLPSSTRIPHEDLYADPHGQALLDEVEERLPDNLVTPPPDAAAFRVDWPWFLRGLTRRDREMALFLSLGNSGKAAAAKFGLSPGRVTQLRQRWCREWRACQGEGDAGPEGGEQGKR